MTDTETGVYLPGLALRAADEGSAPERRPSGPARPSPSAPGVSEPELLAGLSEEEAERLLASREAVGR